MAIPESEISKTVNKTKMVFNRKAQKILDNPLGFIRNFITFVGVTFCSLIVWLTLQPGLIFSNTTPTGGDMGAHVWWPAFMRDYLLPNGRIFGWTMDFYSGFPVGQYYFPVPALMVVALDVIMPYNVAFKLVTVIGSVAFPVSAYYLGRSIKAVKPIPLLMAFAATAFLFFNGDTRATETGSTLANYSNAQFNQRIMGGPLLSAMAGEFSFSIALTFSLFFLGAFFVLLRDGKGKVRVAVLLALTIMSHLVVGIFVAFAALMFWGVSYVVRNGMHRKIGGLLIAWVLSLAFGIGVVGRYFFDNEIKGSVYDLVAATILVGATIAILVILGLGYKNERRKTIGILKDAIPLILGLLLSSIWLVPLLIRFGYTSNMRYDKLVDLPETLGVNEVYHLYIAPAYFWWPVFLPAAIGFILSATFLRKSILPILLTAVAMVLVFVQWPEGHAWNLRFLPFWYLFIFFVAAFGYGELFRLPTAITSRMAYSNKNRDLLNISRLISILLSLFLVVGFIIALIGLGKAPVDVATGCVSGEDARIFPDRRGIADSWARYNFEGYERKPQDNSCKTKKINTKNYTSSIEFKSLMEAMNGLEPGRALWEPHEGSYGTTIALTLIPYYTDHKIASQEGLYYEAAGSTGYHFLSVAELSLTPSNPMRWPKCKPGKDGSLVETDECFITDYGNISDFDRGVAHLQMMGVRYFMAHSVEAKAAAANNADLKLVERVADRDGFNPIGWEIFEVKNHDIVEALDVDPIVISDKTETKYWAQSGNKWLHTWFNSVGQYPVFTNGGPENWDRKMAKEALASPVDVTSQNRKSEVKVSKINLEQDKISFHVDKIGEPVIVKVSYYPTFEVSGAKEIYRASPNFMVVVPTSNDVTLEVKRDKVEWLSILLFFVGIAGCILMILVDRRKKSQLSELLSPKH